jgi:hypothetical protein
VQYVQIPEFTDIGDHVSQQVAGAVAGTRSVRQALEKSQSCTASVAKKAGYLK